MKKNSDPRVHPLSFIGSTKARKEKIRDQGSFLLPLGGRGERGKEKKGLLPGVHSAPSAEKGRERNRCHGPVTDSTRLPPNAFGKKRGKRQRLPGDQHHLARPLDREKEKREGKEREGERSSQDPASALSFK